MSVTIERKMGKIATVFVEGEPWRDVHMSIIKGMTCVDEFDVLELKGAKMYALRRLAARNTSSFELQKLLKIRLVREETIEKVIAECQHLGYLDDHAWIEGVVRSEVRRGKGKRWIVQKLQAKGVPQEKAEKEVNRFYPSENSELEKLIKKEQERGKEPRKIIASLIRKGFSWEDIQDFF